MKTKLFLFFNVLLLTQIKAQVTTLMQDVNAGLANSSPSLFTVCGAINTIFFIADNGTNGSELWKYDMVAATASLVKDINPGVTGSGIIVITTNASGNGILFNANDGTNGNELWKSDGTAAGTNMILDINAGSASSNPNNFYAFGGTFIFSADNGTNGKEPWLTNGSLAGTALLKDINSGSNASDPNNFTALGSKIIFRANDGTNGSELWSTDLTATNTTLLKDINTGTLSSVPLNFVTVGNTLFFSASDATNGAELWKSDGTLAGTQLVKDINTGAGNSINISPGGKGFFTNFNSALYFQATNGSTGYELWKSDGTAAGTAIVKDIQAGVNSSSPSGIIASSSNLFFTANDGTNGSEVWMSDGTSAGTSLLKDINPGAASSTTITTTFILTSNGTIYFAADNGTNGSELWKTLGNSVSTVIVADINPGAAGSVPAATITYNNLLYFSANDGIKGIEPWKFDPNPPTGIKQLIKDDASFIVYPNPSSQQVIITTNQDVTEIQLFSETGQLIFHQKIKSEEDKNIKINEMKTGIYFIKALSGDGVSTKKLIVN